MTGTQIDIRTYTCPEELSPLFDYESKYLFQSHFVATDTCDLVLAGNHTQLLYPEDQIVGPSTLLTIRFEGEECFVGAWGGQLWRIVKELQAEGGGGYRLKQGDEIKLGRCILKVRRLGEFERLAQMDFNQVSLLQDLDQSHVHSPDDSFVHTACRLCLSDENSPGDPLLHPCRCTGSLKYIHLSCIQDWVKTRVSMKESNGRPCGFSWKPVLCEICHTTLPVFLETGGQTYDLFGVECMSLGSYIVLEELNEFTKETTFHVASVYEHASLTIVTVTQGKDEIAGITIADTSVSLTHASITCVKGQFLLRDVESKHGTLIRLGKSFNLRTPDPLSLQVNRTVVVFRRRDQSSFLANCFRCFRGNSRVSTVW